MRETRPQGCLWVGGCSQSGLESLVPRPKKTQMFTPAEEVLPPYKDLPH